MQENWPSAAVGIMGFAAVATMVVAVAWSDAASDPPELTRRVDALESRVTALEAAAR